MADAMVRTWLMQAKWFDYETAFIPQVPLYTPKSGGLTSTRLQEAIPIHILILICLTR
jgi:hypothetical protein